jgi:hypothetical protein
VLVHEPIVPTYPTQQACNEDVHYRCQEHAHDRREHVTKSPESLLQERTDGRCAHHVEPNVKQPSMKDAAGEDAVKLMLVEYIPGAKGEVLKVKVQYGL